MVKSKDELIAQLQMYIGNRTDDDSLALMEDVSDTLSSVAGTDWQTKLDELDAAWRRRYMDRFNGVDDDVKVRVEVESEPKKDYNELFKED